MSIPTFDSPTPNDNYKEVEIGIKSPDGALRWFGADSSLAAELSTEKGRAAYQQGHMDRLKNLGIPAAKHNRIKFYTRERVVVFVNEKKIVEGE